MNCLDENRVLAFLQGRMRPDELAEAEAHLTRCDACSEMIELSARAVMTGAMPSAAPVVASPPTRDQLARGATVGRYVVLSLIGSGAMGEVYAAFDPELNRKIALKLLRSRSETAEGRARLLREAQAIAKLQHPNVVVVHDAGTIGEHVFIAMEFVEGQTVRAWLGAARRSTREVLDVYLSAGRGLAAAHARGLVHRDFKPDNVMVTTEGQVRVMDFGLARHAGEADGADPAGDASLPAALDVASVKLTQTGAIVGTPAYMAPEQFTDGQADARTDQFTFCVALHEGLYGVRPFGGATLGELIKNVTSADVVPAPSRSRVPGWVRRVLLRGLAKDPDARFPSMSALLTALQTDPTVRARRLAAAVALVACVGGGIALARRGAGARQASCHGAGARWSDVWERSAGATPRREAIHRAFAATGTSYAENAFAGAARLLDEYVDRWSEMYVDACEATSVRGEQSEQVLDLRMGCLQERLTSARALTAVFAAADKAVVENAISAAGALPSVERCADVAALRAVVKPPDQNVRKRVDELRDESARLTALREAGHCAEAEKMAQSLLPKVAAVGYEPLVAETLLTAGMLASDCVPVETAIERWREAFKAAVAARHDEAAAEVAIVMTQAFADRGLGALPARQWLTVATAMLERTSKPPRLVAWLLNSEVEVLVGEGRPDEAIRVARQAVATDEKLLSKDTIEVAQAHVALGNALAMAGRHEEALRAARTAGDIWTRVLGARHPRMAIAASNAGEALTALHRWAEARASFQEALDIWRASGTSGEFIAYADTGLGLALLGEGRAAEAIAPLEEAVRLRAAGQLSVERLADSRFALARALWSRPDERPRALELARLARAEYARGQGAAAKATLAEIDAWLAPAEGLLGRRTAGTDVLRPRR